MSKTNTLFGLFSLLLNSFHLDHLCHRMCRVIIIKCPPALFLSFCRHDCIKHKMEWWTGYPTRWCYMKTMSINCIFLCILISFHSRFTCLHYYYYGPVRLVLVYLPCLSFHEYIIKRTLKTETLVFL